MVPASKMCLFRLLVLMFLYIFCSLRVCIGSDTISLGQSLYGNQSLISKGGKFELGFFSPNNFNNHYIGIWYKNIRVKTVVWVLNRATPFPLSNNSQLVLSENGDLSLFSDFNTRIWSVNISYDGSPVANKGVLLDTGNFVLSDGLGVIRQSFDYPTDTWLPGGKIGIEKTSTNARQVLTSWKNPNDPSPGIFSLGMDQRGSPEFFVWRNQSQIVWRSGAWNGQSFGSVSKTDALNNFSYDSNEQAKYITYNGLRETVISRYVLSPGGQLSLIIWSEKAEKWIIYISRPARFCEVFASCGAFGVCNMESSPACQCVKGFEPRFIEDWDLADFSGGCVRSKLLQCNEGSEVFERISNIRLPAYSRSLDLESAQVCEFACSANCSCTAYAYSDSDRCLLWTGDLLDSERLVNSGGDLYLRFSEAPLKSDSQNRKLLALFITLPLLICTASTYLLWRICRKRRNQTESKETNQNLLLLNLDGSKADTDNISTGNTLGGKKTTFDLPQFSFSSISIATNNFSVENKLGEGGFGPVYKGNLLDGQSVAVKRLSKRSGQGLEELRNETALIAKLQHRNLVRLLGCCIEQNEKILIYEYMPNKSLDYFLFDPNKQDVLDWRRRVQIIEGISQGLLYLHQHSRLRIVHRDLKASNILLDSEMNPKISDFGMARIFGGDEMQANTHRIVGTYGYMSPEYAMEGLFSVKSDVFAFGVLLLEILSGKKNTGFRNSDCLSLLGYAWELWKNNRVLELIDSKLDNIPSASFMPLRFIHVGLLCVQDSPADRPNISDVLAMFSNENMQLVLPKRPAFTGGGSSGSGADKAQHCSANDLTASVMEGR